MLAPKDQWCVMVDVTALCSRKCSNCTRLVAHYRKPFFMDVDTFRQAVESLVEFTQQGPDRQGRRRIIGIMGGEPLLHPQFPEFVDIMCDLVPMEHRGLWTGLDWRNHRHADAVVKLLGPEPSMDVNRGPAGYLNHNAHEPPSTHQPPLVAIQDVVADDAEMWRLIDQCWLQEQWSSSITHKGFFFCEVAAAMDSLFGGPGGLPITPGCWKHDIADYRDQIERWCPRCGYCLYDRQAGRMAVPGLQGRLDCEERDDVTRSNLEALKAIGSPRIARGDYTEFVPIGNTHDTHNPQRYR